MDSGPCCLEAAIPDGGAGGEDAHSSDGGVGPDGGGDAGGEVSGDAATGDAGTDGEQDAGASCTLGTRCGDECVDTSMDRRHCGGCGVGCTAPPNAESTCIDGGCGFACDSGFADCNGDADDGCEIDLQADDASCGACGVACGDYQTCDGGTCVDLPYGLTGRASATTCRLTDPPPPRVSATGCYADVTTRAPAGGLVPYSVNSLLWADGTGKRRFLVVPPGGTIGYRDEEAWTLPVGTILIKEFLLETVQGDPSSTIALETRFLVRRSGGWDAVTYKWNDAQTEADIFSGGRDSYVVTRTDGTTDTYTHWFPSRTECTFCHNGAVGVAIGMRTLQMNRAFDYGGVTDNQLRALENAGFFSSPLPGPASSLPAMPDPLDASAPLVERARSYLEGNCAHCHRPGGPTERDVDLRYLRPFAMTNTCDVVPESEDFGIAGARIIAPGDPARSILYQRVIRRGYGQMPIVGSLRVDAAGSALLRDWITSLTGCP